jgi:hypothetical protein
VSSEVHPSAEELAAFALGKRTAADPASIEFHLLRCDACTRLLERQPEDALLRLARGAEQGRADTSAQGDAVPTRADPPPSLRGPTTVPHVPAAGAVEGLPPELFGHARYRITRLLGRGGMGVVYAAEHLVMQRPVAVKVIHRAYTARATAVERFRREVRAAARLQHPNIVTAHDADQAGDVHFLVMEMVEGVGLGRLLVTRGPLPAVEACDYVRQAALGLQHAHERGMVHRDVKPDNLMLTADGTVKLLDFGLAALTVEAGADGLTEPDAVMGTPDYMAPEQAEDARAADTRSDIYSLGCTLYHLLTGRTPYPAATTLKKILAHREKPPPMADLGRDVPPGLTAVLARMLAKDPADRFQVPGEVATALAPFAGRVPAAPAPAAARKPRRLIVAALLALLVTAAAVWYFYHHRGPTEKTLPTDDPSVALVVRGRRVVRVLDPQTAHSWDVENRHYWLDIAEQPDGLTIDLPEREPVNVHLAGDGKLTVVKKGPDVAPPARSGALTIAWSTRICKAPATECLTKAVDALGRQHNFISAEIRDNAVFGADERTAVVVFAVPVEGALDVYVEVFGPDRDEGARLCTSVVEHICHGPYDPAVPPRIVTTESKRRSHAPVLRLAGEARNQPLWAFSDAAVKALRRQGLPAHVHDDRTVVLGHVGTRGAVIAYEEPQGDVKGYVSVVTAAMNASDAERMMNEIQADVFTGKKGGQ